MRVQVTKTENRFEISSLLEKILLKQVRWCLTFVEFIIFGLILDTINRMFVLLLIIWRCTSEKKIQFDEILSFSVTCTFLIFYCPRIWKNLFKLPASNTSIYSINLSPSDC
jgi:hypothetical protein